MLKYHQIQKTSQKNIILRDLTPQLACQTCFELFVVNPNLGWIFENKDIFLCHVESIKIHRGSCDFPNLGQDIIQATDAFQGRLEHYAEVPSFWGFETRSSRSDPELSSTGLEETGLLKKSNCWKTRTSFSEGLL